MQEPLAAPNPIWYPFTQMQTAPEPIEIVRGEGPWIYTQDGRKLLDGISSWWVTIHGHAHPHIAQAIAQQAGILEQVIFAGFTHPQAIKLAQRLIEKLPQPLEKVFFSDDGSTAVEVALKMAWQYHYNLGSSASTLLALDGAYHGDTFGAMSLSARSIFTKAYDPLLFEVKSLPSPADVSVEETIQAAEDAIQHAPAAAIILEPLIQGAGGMKMYTPEALSAIVRWAKAKGILVIFDEVMTGFYRTGKLFAAQHITESPDIICLSKGLTGGFLPLSVTACNAKVYNAFLSQDRSKALFHGHSFTANPIGCAAANASLDLFEQAETQEKVTELVQSLTENAKTLQQHPRIENIRQTGLVLAFDLKSGEKAGYLSQEGKEIARKLLDKGYFLRPLGNTFYYLPPISTPVEELNAMTAAFLETLNEKP